MRSRTIIFSSQSLIPPTFVFRTILFRNVTRTICYPPRTIEYYCSVLYFISVLYLALFIVSLLNIFIVLYYYCFAPFTLVYHINPKPVLSIVSELKNSDHKLYTRRSPWYILSLSFSAIDDLTACTQFAWPLDVCSTRCNISLMPSFCFYTVV